MKETLIITPTHGKPDLALEHFLSMQRTAPEATVLIVASIEDPLAERYKELFHNRANLFFSSRKGYGHKANQAAIEIYNNYDYYLLASDDMFGIEEGWLDKLIERVNPDGVSLLWPNDLLNHPHRPSRELARFPFATRTVLSALGYFAVPCLTHYYIDDAWTSLANAIGRPGYVDESRVEHRHQSPIYPSFGDDSTNFIRWKNEGGFARDVQALKEAMK